jgi:hypothetical protein
MTGDSAVLVAGGLHEVTETLQSGVGPHFWLLRLRREAARRVAVNRQHAAIGPDGDDVCFYGSPGTTSCDRFLIYWWALIRAAGAPKSSSQVPSRPSDTIHRSHSEAANVICIHPPEHFGIL